MAQFGFFIDTSACSGCKTCQVACKDKNNLEPGILWRRVYEISGGNWEKGSNGGWKASLSTYNLSVACNHCEEPGCVEACPTKALYKEEKRGLVLIDEDKCIGCRYCEWACPYGALQFDRDRGIMSKCDFCVDYLDVGSSPSCVASCPMRALDFGEISELTLKYGNMKHIYPMADPEITKPCLVIKPHPEAETARSNNARVANKEEVKQ